MKVKGKIRRREVKSVDGDIEFRYSVIVEKGNYRIAMSGYRTAEEAKNHIAKVAIGDGVIITSWTKIKDV